MSTEAYDAKITHGLVLTQLRRYDEAIGLAEEAQLEHPEGAEACFLLGLVAERRGDQGLAIKFFERAHDLDQDCREYADALAIMHAAVGHLADSVYYAKLAVALEPHPRIPGMLPPDFQSLPMTFSKAAPSAHYVMARSAFIYGDFESAARECEAELRINPGHFEATRLLAETLVAQRKVLTAVHFAHAAVHLDANDPATRIILADALLGCGRHAAAAASYRAGLRLAGDDDEAVTLGGRAIAGLLACGESFAALDNAFSRRAAAARPKRTRPAPEVRIRPNYVIGLIGDCFLEHPLASILLPLLRLNDSEKVIFFVYQQNRRSDIVTTRMRGQALRWREIYDVDDATVARIMRTDEIDLLIDLSGFSQDARPGILAHNPAPVATRWLGWPVPWKQSEGASTLVSPLHADAVAAQGGLPLPVSGIPFPYEFRCSAPSEPEPGPSPWAETGIVTFGGVLDPARLTPATAELWARVLLAIPSARLFLGYHPSGDDAVREQVLDLFAHFGVAHRIFVQTLDPSGDAKLAFFATIDVMLDAPGGPSCIEAADALWMGVPVIALLPPRYLGPDAAAVLAGIGMEAWICKDEDGFVAAAGALMADPGRLAELRAGLRSRMEGAGMRDGWAFIEALLPAVFAAGRTRGAV